MKMQKRVDVGVCHENEYYEVDVTFSYYYDAGRSYMSNGDPGYPSEESLDIIRIHNEVPSQITDEMIIDALYEIVDDIKDEDI